MLCLGNSLVTLVICIVCVLISIVPIKTSRRALQNSSGAVAEERTGGSEPEVTTKHAETTLPVDGQTQVKAMRMSALWPRSPEGRYHVIPYYVVEPDNEEEAANGFYIDEIFDYISKRTCVQFQRKSWKVPECSVRIHEPTVCIKARKDSDLCFSDATGIDWYNWRELNEAQILYMPPGWGRCPFHEGVQSVAKLLGLLPEHRRADRDELLRVMVTAAGSDQLLFAQGQTAKCTDYEDDSPLDLFSVSGFDTSASTLRGASAARMRNLEHGMVMSARNIRHQWILDYKRQRDMGLSFYDQRDIVRAYNCEQLWNCIPQNAPCENGGFRNSSCRCECPYGFGGDTCSRRTASGERDLNSKCTATVRSRTNFTLADIGLEHDGRTFYACDLTLMPPGCMRPLIVVNTSSLRTLRTMDNPDWQNLNFCELYFTLLLKHSVFGWRTYCLDYFFNDETLMFMPHASIEQTYAYMKMHAPSKERFAMIASITFSITFVEVPECSKKGATDGSGGASTKVRSYNVMTAVFSYFFGMLLVIVAWTLKRALFVSHDEYNIPQATAGSSGSSSYESMGTPPLTPLPSPTPTPRTPSPAPQPPPPPPDIRLPPPEWHVTDTAASDPSAADRRRSPSPTGRSPQQYPTDRSPQQYPTDRPPQQYPGDRPPQPYPGQRPAPQQELHLPPIGGGPQQLSPRQGGLRASFMQWGGAALSSLRASFVGGSSEPPPPPQRPRPPPRGRPYPPQGRPRPPPGRGPPPGHRPPPQGGGPRPPPQGRGPRPPPQGGAYRPPPPQGGGYRPPPPQNGSRSPPPPRYKTAPSRPGPPRKGPT